MTLQDDDDAAEALIQVMRGMIGDMTLDLRLAIPVALLTDELCTLPPGLRHATAERIADTLPIALALAEKRHRDNLARKAREDK
jgi:hypothetical protein